MVTKRSLQETLELVVFGLIALLIGTGVLWLVGWVLGLIGALFTLVASFIWTLLRFILPVVIVAAAIYLLVRYLAGRSRRAGAPASRPTPPTVTATVTAPRAPEVRTVPNEAVQPETSEAHQQPEAGSDGTRPG
jgi:energy-coupling factor transporter transmembrane protein EcfT